MGRHTPVPFVSLARPQTPATVPFIQLWTISLYIYTQFIQCRIYLIAHFTVTSTPHVPYTPHMAVIPYFAGVDIYKMHHHVFGPLLTLSALFL